MCVARSRSQEIREGGIGRRYKLDKFLRGEDGGENITGGDVTLSTPRPPNAPQASQKQTKWLSVPVYQ